MGNILATENQQARINGVIEVKKACICKKLKQIQLRTTKNTPSSSDALKSGKPVFMRLSGFFLCAVTLL